MIDGPRVAVLGAGITGASTALFLARRGARVTLFDQAPASFAGASRWNEGKIHLGFLYAADPTLRTAKQILPGGLAFPSLVEELIGYRLDQVTTPGDDIYLVHRDSVIEPDAMQSQFQRTAELTRALVGSDRYLTDVSRCAVRPLTRCELDAMADTRTIVAGFRVPERSVSTRWIADRYIEALAAEPALEPAMNTRVVGVSRDPQAGPRSRWFVNSTCAAHGPFDHVVNALWEGRAAVDATVGLQPQAAWSHRFRLSLFIRTHRSMDIPSAVIATGPFGDVKNYGGRDFYLSWYPAGLLAEGHDLKPPKLPELDDQLLSTVRRSIQSQLAALLPSVADIGADALEVTVNGGWVFAIGNGSLSDRDASLHRRDRIGIRRSGTYISVDTGKYSIAPWLARSVADSIIGG